MSTLTAGTVASFLQLLRRFYQPLQALADKFNTLQQAMAASQRIFRLRSWSLWRAWVRIASSRACRRSSTRCWASGERP